MNTLASCGFTYAASFRDAVNHRLLDRALVKNRVPVEGLNLFANGLFAGGAIPTAFYIGLWSGAHTPNGAETAADFLTQVTEVTAYEGGARKAWTPGSVSNGGVSNSEALARFNFTSDVTVNGMFMTTSSPKGATAGAIVSVVRFPSPRPVDPSVYLDVLAGFQLVSM
ncbi:MAG: hypothetical protein EOO27_33940 [Comamonadaceae bacterium]|nr:MAG: hypothetical protein EOO27_33940 [Comamonadaceae bacterium]